MKLDLAVEGMQGPPMPDFGLVDTLIVVFYLALSVAIGLLANRFISGLSGYLVAGRSLGTALSVATMTGSELGLITVMYQAQKGFTGGFAALHIGLIAGIVGGIVVGSLSGSPLGVSGPAAGLAVIVLNGIESLPSLEMFAVAVMIGGLVQVVLGLLRAGVIGLYFPSAVIQGMLAAIGIIIFLKQLPHAVGFDESPRGRFNLPPTPPTTQPRT